MVEERKSAPPEHRTINATTNGGPSSIKQEGQAQMVDGGAHISASSSSSPRFASSSTFERLKDDRQTRSSSPAVIVRRNARLSGAHDVQDMDQNPFEIGEDQASALERQEIQHLQTRASTSSSTILPPAPNLPYDMTYPPLSPMGVDQIGHSLASRFPLQAAQMASATAAANRKSNGASSSFDVAQTANSATRHLTSNEKAKRPLPGQELEQHMVSTPVDAQAPSSDQRPMPWGLQTTLLDRARDAPRNRTKMGTLKRLPPHENKTRSTPHVVAKATDDEIASEQSTPHMTAIELEQRDDEAAAAEASSDHPFEGEQGAAVGEPITSTPQEAAVITNGSTHGAVAVEEQGEGATESEAIHEPAKEMNGDDSVMDVSLSSITAEIGSVSQQSSVKKRRRKASTHELNALRLENGFASMSDEAGVGDTTADSAGASTRRPRAAHKRLKMIGGYYGRNPKAAPEENEEDVEQQSSVLEDQAEISMVNGHSRAASSAPDGEARAQSAAAEEPESAALLLAPSTPLKASQPSLSMGLRQSATKSQSGKMVHAGAGLPDNGEGNNEYCDTCHGIGHFICCDGCPRSFHFACINPPLDIDELPKTVGDAEDKWFCNVCKSERLGKVNGGKKGRKLLAPLVSYIESVNPTIFSLPQEIRNYFKGVATATDGSYVDSTMLRPLKIGKFGLVDERDPFKLKDRNGKPVLCYRCGQSALPPPSKPDVVRNGGRRTSPRKSSSVAPQEQQSAPSATPSASDVDRTGWLSIIGCDFCALHWHLDCLEPPMATMPSISRKWMCPNHVEHAMRSERIPKSVANSTSIHDLPVPSAKSLGVGKHYRMRVVNDGMIDIIPDPLDTYFGSSSSAGGAITNGNGNVKTEGKTGHAGTHGNVNENRGRGLDKGWEEQDIPSTTLSEFPLKNANVNANLKFKYRVPEKVIRLDFWHRAEMERERALAACLHRIEQGSRVKLDTLAGIADAALSALVTDESNVKTETDEDPARLSHKEAALLAERLFGSQTMRNYYPDPDVASDPQNDDRAEPNDSSLRQTFVPGEYEVEFEARAFASIAANEEDGKASANAAAANVVAHKKAMASMSEERKRARDESLASQLDVDAVEVAQLRAVQALMKRKGPQAMLDFLVGQQGVNDGIQP